MKRILLFSNGFSFSPNVLQYAIDIAKNNKASLHALQLSSLKPHDHEGYILPAEADKINAGYTTEINDEAILKLKDDEKQRLENLCIENNIVFTFYKIRGNFLDSIVDQSIFADLIICDEKIDEKKFSLNSLMVNAHCPVLSVPDDASPFTEIILTFDESFSSMYSIRQFSYLFSCRLHLPAYLVSVLPHNVIGLEYHLLLNEWLKLYYSNISIEILKGKANEELPSFINRHKNAIVVMGSFGRSSLSRLFKDSLANIILHKTRSVIFTTHD